MYVENQPRSVDIYNGLVRKVAAEHPGTVTVYELNKEFRVKEDAFTSTIDGYTVRTSDGIHFTLDAGELADKELLPLVDRLEPSAPIQPVPESHRRVAWSVNGQLNKGPETTAVAFHAALTNPLSTPYVLDSMRHGVCCVTILHLIFSLLN